MLSQKLLYSRLLIILFFVSIVAKKYILFLFIWNILVSFTFLKNYSYYCLKQKKKFFTWHNLKKSANPKSGTQDLGPWKWDLRPGTLMIPGARDPGPWSWYSRTGTLMISETQDQKKSYLIKPRAEELWCKWSLIECHIERWLCISLTYILCSWVLYLLLTVLSFIILNTFKLHICELNQWRSTEVQL